MTEQEFGKLVDEYRAALLWDRRDAPVYPAELTKRAAIEEYVKAIQGELEKCRKERAIDGHVEG